MHLSFMPRKEGENVSLTCKMSYKMWEYLDASAKNQGLLSAQEMLRLIVSDRMKADGKEV